MWTRAPLLALVLLLGGGAASSAAEPVRVDAGDGATLVVEPDPFRLALLDRDGREVVATVAAREGAPLRPPGVDGPQPAEPLGPLGGFPALGWVAGAQAGATWPLPAFTGNRIFGAEGGVLVSATKVDEVRGGAQGVELRLATDAGLPARLAIKRLPGGGVQLDAEPPEEVAAVSTITTLASPPGEGLYGLGARKDRFDQRGLLRNVWTEEQNASDERVDPVVGDYTFPNGGQAAYFVQAALFGGRGWAAWAGQTELSRVDLAASRADAIRWGIAAPRLTLSLAAGGLEAASRAYTAAQGRAPAPPRFVYEPWIDVINEGEGEAAPNGSGFSGGERVRRELTDIAAAARREGIPLGVLGVEGWHRVPDGERFFAGLRRDGLRLAAYWNPFTTPGTPAYEEAVREGVLVRDARGAPYELVNNRGGRASVIDFSHPASGAYWARQLQRSRALGFEAFMHDFGEFVTEGMRFHSGRPAAQEHNAYPVRMHAAARAAISPSEWFYVRSGYDGVTASTSGVFPGDETTDWSEGSGLPSVIPAMLNLALGGAYTFTTDVGGYFDLTAPRTTPELMTRWAQLAALTPVSRIHDSTFNKSVYPWELGPQTLDAYRRYARLKVRLVPLIDAWSKRAARDGTVGPVRPLVLDDPSPAARAIDDQWLLGSDLLVAPIVRRGARERRVYLPAGGVWERVTVGPDGALVPTLDAHAGGKTVTAPAPLADIPIYQRLGEAARPGCRDRVPPRSRVSRAGRTLRGRSSDRGCAGLLRVRVSIARKTGRRCRFADARGRLARPRSCHRTSYVAASGARRWRVRLPRRLPRGRYQVWVRGIDAAGNVERKDRRRNLARLTVRP